ESAASAPDWPMIHRVSGDSAYDASISEAFAARAEIWTPAPSRSGMVKARGLVAPRDPNRHELSATTNELVASGTTTHGLSTVRVVVSFETTMRSWPAPVPFVIRTVADL